MPKYRVVLDTNVIVSAFLKPHSLPRRSVQLALSAHSVIESADTLVELHRVLLSDKFDRYVARATRSAFLHELQTLVELVAISGSIAACRDPLDDKFLNLAIDGRADAIITGDADLLALHPFRDVAIVTPEQFLKMGS